MKRHQLPAAALLGAAAGLAACSSTSRTAPPATVSFAAPQYVQQAAMGDQFEIQSGRLALERSQNPTVRSFAEQMIRDHSASSSQLKAAAAAENVSAPAALDPQHAQMLQQQRGLHGQQFDSAYMQMQLHAHREALATQQTYSKAGDDAQLRQLAAQATPMVEHHLTELQTVWRNVASAPPMPAPSAAPGTVPMR